ncbi:MAG: arginine--tRNA ligase [Spirochaetaceae bacterium]|nr:arginine--tRNA ligase [Spirochaetaceae bacterium]MCF7947996.1 arginine--tRNA ligase [Spirochaetia bacterium]MCF7952190.1 arginine--tRNA ligase [Spirochaetaceae bacterium]
MEAVKEQWKQRVAEALREVAVDHQIDPTAVEAESVVVETPPTPELGDIAFPLFPFARIFKTAPAKIAAEVAEKLTLHSEAAAAGTVQVAGPYLNVALKMVSLAGEVCASVLDERDSYGRGQSLQGTKVMIEFSCPNTNKPLHLGHLRNDALGESVARILGANGADVQKVNLINDRGIHICKSMLAYKKFADGATPESEGLKSDHFVGKYYVKFDQWSKQDPQAEPQAREMLKAWEADDPEVTELWRRMNRWTIEGIETTYAKTGVSFDKIYYESQTFKRGREEVLKGLEKGTFYKEADGSVWVDLSEIDLDRKVLLRSDGTSLYLTQDIGTAIERHQDWPFERMIYVVASEQRYHFKVLFHVLKKLGFGWADNLYHLSYGMVNLPEGKMKSREGTVVDADDLFEQLQAMAAEEIRSKDREEHVGDVEKAAAAVAQAALNYYLLQVAPARDMIFNPEESISFNGNTGPYLQYMGARISSMLRKYEDRKAEFSDGNFQPELLEASEERSLIKLLAEYPEVVRRAGEEYNPNLITTYLYDISRTFSKFYHDHPVLHNDDPNVVITRVTLVRAILQVLQNAYFLVGIPFLERM